MFVYMKVVMTRHKCQRMPLSDLHTGHQEISDNYNDFRTYIIVGSLRDSTNTLYLHKSYRTVLVTYQTSTVINSLNPLCNLPRKSIASSYEPKHTSVSIIFCYLQNNKNSFVVSLFS